MAEGTWASAVSTDGRSGGSDLIYMNGSTDYVELWVIATGSSLSVTYGPEQTKLSGYLARPA